LGRKAAAVLCFWQSIRIPEMIKFKNVYRLVQQIPPGKVATYGQVAKVLGEPKQARVVGWALHVNKDPEVPCHRVVAKDGRLADSFAHGGREAQRFLLRAEGVEFFNNRHVDLKRSGLSLLGLE
jgi:methylated-DNA-protein-cysteine methyltransferase-like protein